MNIVQVIHEDYVQLEFRNEHNVPITSYQFNSKEDVKTFMKGWRACQSFITGEVQRLPQTVDTETVQVKLPKYTVLKNDEYPDIKKYLKQEGYLY